MTKKSAIVLALGMVAAILSAAFAMSLNLGIGDTAESAPLVKTAQEKKAEKRKPIVKTRRITIKRERQASGGGGGTMTVVRNAPSGGSGPSVSSASGSGGDDHESDYEDHGSEHEHESEHEGGDD